MKFKNRITAALLCLVIMLFSVGCDDNSDKRIYIELTEIPKTLDPQTASTDSELMLVRNLFEGLVRVDGNGEIKPGVAQNYEQNGATYTFHLRKNACWYTGDPLTANDFVFGMRRAADPKTESPFASRLGCISGASAILNGTASTDTLGVTAADDHTVIITLAYEDPNFLKNLATAPFMPCNEDFFNKSIGKYGLEKQYIMANGSYYLAKWSQTEFGIRIYKNAVYHGEFTALNGGVFFSKNEKSSPYSELSSGAADVAFLKGNLLSKAKALGFKAETVENICWFLTLNSEYGSEMRHSLAQLINREKLIADEEGLRAADSVYPAVLNINSDAGITGYDADAGKAGFSAAVKATDDKKFPKTTLRYADDAVADEIIKDMIGHWQQTLSAFINMEAAKNPDALIAQLKDQSLQMAVFPVTAKSSSVSEYLSNFTDNTAGDPVAVQQQLLKGCNIIPLFFESTCIAYSPSLTGLRSDNSGGYIDFSQIVKTG